MCISLARHNSSTNDTNTAPYSGFTPLAETVHAAAFKWRGALDSDMMWDSLFEEFYSHGKLERWGAFVLNDTIDHWIESTVYVDTVNASMSAKDIFDSAKRAQRFVCESNGTSASRLDEYLNANFSDVYSRPPPPYPQASAPRQGADTYDVSNILQKIANSTSNGYTSADGSTAPLCMADIRMENDTIAFTSYKALHAALTMLTNVSTDHAAPIFLKVCLSACERVNVTLSPAIT